MVLPPAAVRAAPEPQAHRVVLGAEAFDRFGQHVHRHRPAQPQVVRVVEMRRPRHAGGDLGEEPFLRRGDRRLTLDDRLLRLDDRCGRPARGAQLGDRRVLYHLARGDRDARLDCLEHHPDGEQRVPAEVEEVVVDADLG
jgi:hypothetical protein